MTNSTRRRSGQPAPTVSPPSPYTLYYAVIRKIPRGRVATYGQIARLAGRPGNARQVGYALSVLCEKNVPWHRVLNASGRISHRGEPGSIPLQSGRLEKEGVVIHSGGRIALSRFQWKRGARDA